MLASPVGSGVRAGRSERGGGLVGRKVLNILGALIFTAILLALLGAVFMGPPG